ncbi:apolipoprotein N-acyltransferase [Oscillatoria sp. CS-180]|uniref:apolipoprotein N-acyltransferase n=1 Tax=Oscillatoria sp. CS-180 TaxID=3021720 RepID=UPI00232D54E9|nr:apolipoprotein N-acyltransferase [Oscillatoria sp. CS-180]MDB9524413.1 apolipoprotein N-acyltransferase [Oscillatoria sp. CS-180]
MGKPPSQGRNRPTSVAKSESRRLFRSGLGTISGSLNRWRFWRSPWGWVLIGGVLMGLTPAPTNLWPLAWIALVPLWRAVVDPLQPRSGWTRFQLGALWSGIYHGIVLSWITHLHPLTWMGVPWLASIAIALFAWGFITGLGTVTFGLWAVLIGWLSDRRALGVAGRLLVGTALWCFLETVLSWGPLAWPFLAFTQSPHNLGVLHLGQLAGPMTVTAAIVAVNGAWAEASLGYARYPAQGWSWRWQPFLGGLVLLVGVHGLGGILYSQPLAEPAAASLKIGLIQGNVPTRVKLTPAGTRQAIAAYTDGYKNLVAQGADAVLTPEGAIPEVWIQNRQIRSPIRQAVIQEGVVLWLGTFRPVADQFSRDLHQSLVNLDVRGQVTSQYNKVKLVPLGEYIPLESLLGRLISRLSPVSSSLKPGRFDQVFETPFGQAVIGICYESAYSNLFRLQTAHGGEWIMTASNNDPYPPRMMMQHHAQDVMRAIESDRWSVRVTNTGISGLVSPRGATLWLSSPNQYGTYLAQIYKRQTQTLYVRWGNWLTYGLLLAGGVTSLSSVRKEASATQISLN